MIEREANPLGFKGQDDTEMASRDNHNESTLPYGEDDQNDSTLPYGNDDQKDTILPNGIARILSMSPEPITSDDWLQQHNNYWMKHIPNCLPPHLITSGEGSWEVNPTR